MIFIASVERCDAAVMKIGSGDRHIAEARDAKDVAVGFAAGDAVTTEIGARAFRNGSEKIPNF